MPFFGKGKLVSLEGCLSREFSNVNPDGLHRPHSRDPGLYRADDRKIFRCQQGLCRQRAFKNYWVAVVMGAFFLLMTFYARIVVPIQQKKGEERVKSRVRRRPGRESAS